MIPVPTPPIGDDDLQALIDERLPAERRAFVEAWLRENPEAAARVETDRAHRDALRVAMADVAAQPISARLRVGTIKARRNRTAWRGLGQIAAAVVLLVLGGAGGFLAHDNLRPRTTVPTTRVTQDAVSAFRIYTVEVAHPVEVASSEQKHLLQWLSKRLGRSLSAPDLGTFGYRLVGGRLLPSGETAAAMLMYERESGARLTVYVRAGEGGETAFRFRSDGDLSTFAWLDGGFGFAVSAAVPRETLQPIVNAVYRDFDAK